MNPIVVIFAILFAIAGYGEAKRVRERYGRYPFGWPPAVWAAVMFLSWLIGIVLLAIASRIVRRSPGAAPQPTYVQPVPTHPMYGPRGYTPQPYAAQPYAPQPSAPQAYGAPGLAPQPYAPQPYAAPGLATQPYAPPSPAPTGYTAPGYAPPGIPAGVELNPFAPPTDILPGR